MLCPKEFDSGGDIDSGKWSFATGIYDQLAVLASLHGDEGWLLSFWPKAFLEEGDHRHEWSYIDEEDSASELYSWMRFQGR